MAPAADSPEALPPATTKGVDDAFNSVIQGMAEDPDALTHILTDKHFDTTGKADDAVDFEDISDDDLPEEEDALQSGASSRHGSPGSDAPVHAHDEDDDDLWGDGDMEQHFA